SRATMASRALHRAPGVVCRSWRRSVPATHGWLLSRWRPWWPSLSRVIPFDASLIPTLHECTESGTLHRLDELLDADPRGTAGHPRESVEHYCSHHDEARQDQHAQRGPASSHPAGKSIASAPFPDVESNARRHTKHAAGDEDPPVLHGDRHERPAPEAEGDD